MARRNVDPLVYSEQDADVYEGAAVDPNVRVERPDLNF